MGGGGKGGGGGGGGDTQMVQFLRELSGETKPLREKLSAQFQEALDTGGVGAQIPLITRMQEQSRMATANALRGTGEQLFASGLDRTPFASSILAGQRMQGDMQTSMIPSQVAQGFVGAAPQFAMAPVGAMISGAGNLNTNATNRDIAKGNQDTQLLTGLMSAAAVAAAAFA